MTHYMSLPMARRLTMGAAILDADRRGFEETGRHSDTARWMVDFELGELEACERRHEVADLERWYGEEAV